MRPLFDYVDGALKDRFALQSKFRERQVNYSLGSGRDILWIRPQKTQLNLLSDAGNDLPDALTDTLASSATIRKEGLYVSIIKTERDFEKIVPLIEHVIRRAQGLQ